MKAEEQLEKFKLELADLMEKYNITIRPEIVGSYVEMYIECNPAYFGTIDN